jgi:Domain of unknown function (DUF5606)
MKLKDIISVSGKPGLHKFISQGRNGIIVEGVSDNKKMLVHSSNKVSALADIAIYTDTEEVPLKEIFKKIYEKEVGKQAISHKSTDEQLKQYFEGILPNYDKNRVYGSDIKKVINWYNVLIEHNLLDPNEKDEEEEASVAETKDAKGEKDDKPVKAKSAAKAKTGAKTDKKPTPRASTQTKTAGGKSKSAGIGKKTSPQ